MARIPFNKPVPTGRETEFIVEAIQSGHIAGNGDFTRRCQRWLEARIGAARAFLTHSCTGALEMCALLARIGPGDEVIMPSFTFVSTANAFALRGGVPVFVDIREDTLNLDQDRIEAAVTPRTKAICPVHYAGVSCEMDRILEIAARLGLQVIEDAAQGQMSSYRGRPLGSMGAISALSFHETKNVTSGEGGALLVNDAGLVERAEVIWEKGTNRGAFFRGLADKYTWVELGSSFPPSEIVAAFLWAQLAAAESVTQDRLRTWLRYRDAFAEDEAQGLVRRPVVPPDRVHNAHLFYLLLPSPEARTALLSHLQGQEIHAVFHYVPLHSSPAGRRHGRTAGSMAVTESVAERLVRLPLWVGISDAEVERVISETQRFLRGGHAR